MIERNCLVLGCTVFVVCVLGTYKERKGNALGARAWLGKGTASSPTPEHQQLPARCATNFWMRKDKKHGSNEEISVGEGCVNASLGVSCAEL